MNFKIVTFLLIAAIVFCAILPSTIHFINAQGSGAVVKNCGGDPVSGGHPNAIYCGDPVGGGHPTVRYCGDPVGGGHPNGNLTEG
jgi:hypothetical protein